MKRLLLVIAAALMLSAYWFFTTTDAVTPESSSYRTETIGKGDISNSVSATGTLAAVDDVIVGAQLSGQITEVYVDFNDTVQAGQLLAQIDPRTFAAKVAQAKAQVNKTQADIALQKIAIERAKVTLNKAKRDLARGEKLALSNNISEDELDVFRTSADQYQLDLQQGQAQLNVLNATLASNKASLEQDQIELNRTEIRAPIDGFVISRTIEAGATVASSLNTPELFQLAKDLSIMEIEAYIDESDIGQLKEQQRVNFNVDAFPDRKFRGQITQIRRSPQSTSGVVSYTVIISANNRDGELLPGMTANLDISIDSVRGIQRVSNAALRLATRLKDESAEQRRGPQTLLAGLDLSEEQKQLLESKMPKRPEGRGPGVSEQQRQRVQQALDDVLTDAQKELRLAMQSGKIKLATLLLLRDGKQVSVPVQIGITDGQYTELLKPDLTGEQVITQIKAGSL
ncbi:efflux RND transporter periplasmic adaptor subunit [Shewanella youngdeokensis]|uniref:Efflux RND transporter periplasmic adaptor subunit n=1 Tax=Shewanella youngdeokensis TaxID=2999068 RepID=A0ABZ0JY23_9GAMM|nr:efflux RND transporter periplasmic adaptor subunit [Shewanella sp. DAU334]